MYFLREARHKACKKKKKTLPWLWSSCFMLISRTAGGRLAPKTLSAPRTVLCLCCGWPAPLQYLLVIWRHPSPTCTPTSEWAHFGFLSSSITQNPLESQQDALHFDRGATSRRRPAPLFRSSSSSGNSWLLWNLPIPFCWPTLFLQQSQKLQWR